MLKPELYKKTVDILYDAYFGDTLRHGDCSACAVGNICAGNGIPRLVGRFTGDNGSYNNASWGQVFKTYEGIGQVMKTDNYDGNVKLVIDATGYTLQELASIENAFEEAAQGENAEDYMFNGLCAVLEVLKEIHEVTDEDADMNTTRFRTHYKKKLVKDGYRF